MTNPKPKEVDYSKYCKKCVHEKLDDFKEPCNTCLEQFWNEGSDKPIKFEEKSK
ncbi:MAG: hypothetical protein IJ523_07310 [Succinivibrionaceae bacterium]|nr:hypothetical protein [Succinivibrionaceae bacterium]